MRHFEYKLPVSYFTFFMLKIESPFENRYLAFNLSKCCFPSKPSPTVRVTQQAEERVSLLDELVEVKKNNIVWKRFNLTSHVYSHTEKQGSCPPRCPWAVCGQRNGLPMEILPCKWGRPLFPYMETVGSSVSNSIGSPLLYIMKTVGSSVGSRVECPWEFCHANVWAAV